MFIFSQYVEGREIITDRYYRLSSQVCTYLSRWVVRDIHEENLDTKFRLHSEWVDQLSVWNSQERHIQAIFKAVVVIYIAAFLSLGILSLDISVSLLMSLVLTLGIGVSYRFIRNSMDRQKRIQGALEITREMLEFDSSEQGLQKLRDIEGEAICPKLKKYLEHHRGSRLYMCQVRGVVEYHQAQILGETRG